MLGKRLADEITIEQLYKWRSKYDEDILCGIEFDSVEEYEDEVEDEDEDEDD